MQFPVERPKSTQMQSLSHHHHWTFRGGTIERHQSACNGALNPSTLDRWSTSCITHSSFVVGNRCTSDGEKETKWKATAENQREIESLPIDILCGNCSFLVSGLASSAHISSELSGFLWVQMNAKELVRSTSWCVRANCIYKLLWRLHCMIKLFVIL